jgi:predicted ATPase
MLAVEDIPDTARVVILAGPNGFGKSSFFDALYQAYGSFSGRGVGWDVRYHGRRPDAQYADSTTVTFHSGPVPRGRQSAHLFYLRTAYRNEPDVAVRQIARLGPATDERRFSRMSENDAAVSINLQRLVAQMVDDVATREPGETTFTDYRARLFLEVDRAMNILFPDLHFVGFGDPMTDGTFLFKKGAIESFGYANLSGGEKAAFDLLLDLAVKRREYYDSIYCIDEPELHMNPAVHGRLLDAMIGIIPDNSQLWLATHSIGMMRRAISIEQDAPGSVVFLDFSNQNFDDPVTLRPIKPTRTFWIESLQVALADLAALVAPDTIIVCEGSSAGKNAEHDATCYNEIFAEQYPEVQFIAGGNAHDVKNDRNPFVAALPAIVKGIRTRRVIDRDDRGAKEIAELHAAGVSVLGRRTIESYLWDDEILRSLCRRVGQEDAFGDVLNLRADALARAQAAGAPADDMKAAAGFAYTAIKRRLGLTGMGNDSRSFERETLAPFLMPGMKVYEELRGAIFS